MISGDLLVLNEYKDKREVAILTNPDSTGSFWVRVRCEWLFVNYIEDEILQVLQVKRSG